MEYGITPYLNVRHRRNIRSQTREHRDQRQHARHQQRDATGYRVQAQPETEPRQHYDQHAGRKGLNQMMADLALEAEVDRQAREVAVLLGHIAVRLVQLQRLAQIVLQQFQLRIEGDAVASPFQAHFLIVVGNWRRREIEIMSLGCICTQISTLTALDVDRTDLDVHRIQLELHLARDNRMHPGRIPNGFVLVQRHRGEAVRQRRDLGDLRVEKVRIGLPQIVEELRRQGDVVVALLEDVVGQLEARLLPRLVHEHVDAGMR